MIFVASVQLFDWDCVFAIMNCHVASLVAAILIWSQIIGHVGGGPIVEQGLAPSLTSKSATTLPKTQYPPPLPEGSGLQIDSS